MMEGGLYEHARKRVKSRKKFYSHIFSWVLMSAFFILLNIFTSDYFWAIFPILGWGIGVAFHGIQVFSDEWEDQEVGKEYERLKKKNMDRYGHTEDEIVEESFHELRRRWKDEDFV